LERGAPLELCAVTHRIRRLPGLQRLVRNEFSPEPAFRIRDRRRDVEVKFVGVIETPAPRHFDEERGIVAIVVEAVADLTFEHGRGHHGLQVRDMRDQIDVVLVGPDRLRRRAYRDRALQANRDGGQEPVIRSGEPVSNAFIALLGEVAMALGRLQILAGLFDEANELRLAQLGSFSEVIHCFRIAF
jgi:hypothetical protein